MSLQLVNSKNPSLAELGLLKENEKDFGLGCDLLSFDYVKFDVNGSAKKKKKLQISQMIRKDCGFVAISFC